MELLERYHKLTKEQDDINKELSNIRAELKARVEESGNIEGHGVRAYMKPGRKKTDHKAAAEAAKVSDDIIWNFSTTNTSVQWAKVTKAAGVDTAPFVSESKPSFVVEVD